jgi:UV DNA damage endonuclease
VYKRIGIPIVFDYHHHMLHPGGQTEQEALELALSTWGDIKPVVHYAESRSVEHNNPKIKPQAHSDLVYNTLNDYGNEFDIMIEAKHKELALLKYRREFAVFWLQNRLRQLLYFRQHYRGYMAKKNYVSRYQCTA